MNLRAGGVVTPRTVKVVAAVVVGLSVGALVPPDAVHLPVVGSVPGLVVGGLGLATGAVFYLWVPTLLRPSGCGCEGDCGCS